MRSPEVQGKPCTTSVLAPKRQACPATCARLAVTSCSDVIRQRRALALLEWSGAYPSDAGSRSVGSFLAMSFLPISISSSLRGSPSPQLRPASWHHSCRLNGHMAKVQNRAAACLETAGAPRVTALSASAVTGCCRHTGVPSKVPSQKSWFKIVYGSNVGQKRSNYELRRDTYNYKTLRMPREAGGRAIRRL
jgi:hypothetical protein